MKREEDKLYFIWRDARQQCYHKNCSMCEEWWGDFNKFREWALGEGYEYENETYFYFLQRKDKEKPFEPSNCFFRVKGKRQNELIKSEGFSLTKEQKGQICSKYKNNTVSTRSLAKEFNVCQRTIINVLKENGINSKTRNVFVKSVDGEEWKLIPGFGDKYYISSLGRIKSMNYKGMAEALMQPRFDNGYLNVALTYKGISKVKKIHRLVAEAFIPNPNNYEIVNHKNEIRHDNRVENLEWCSQEYNARYSSACKVMATDPLTGEIKTYDSIQSTKFDGFNPSLVVKCCKGERTTHGGKTWKYMFPIC